MTSGGSRTVKYEPFANTEGGYLTTMVMMMLLLFTLMAYRVCAREERREGGQKWK